MPVEKIDARDFGMSVDGLLGLIGVSSWEGVDSSCSLSSPSLIASSSPKTPFQCQ